MILTIDSAVKLNISIRLSHWIYHVYFSYAFYKGIGVRNDSILDFTCCSKRNNVERLGR